MRANALRYLTMIVLAWLCMPPAGAALSIYLAPEDLSRRAELIVEGTVSRTASGLDPQSGALATYVTLEVDRVHRGPAGLGAVVLRELGGRYGSTVHEVDAVPRYRLGERVFAFLESRTDGSLRTAGMFFGKYRLERDGRGVERAIRELDGQGRILYRPGTGPSESLSPADLTAVAASVRPQGPRATPHAGSRAAGKSTTPRWRSRPPEFDRLLWDDVRQQEPRRAVGRDNGAAIDLAPSGAALPGPRFVPMSSSNPSRWTASDAGNAVTIHVDRRNDPLNDAAEAVVRIESAMSAWTNVPESRLVLHSGNTNYDYTGIHSQSPAASYSGVNIILFDDPYDDISDPSGCGGVLAIGGYWRTGSTGTPINNVAFHSALQLYVIFNNDFECFLGIPDNLAEVAAHEIGHGIGFGHSGESDAIMRSYAYGFRGARLGDDDSDAAHCTYPHSLNVTRPNGGEVFAVDSVQAIEWSATTESGPDPGSVDLHYSTDGGQSWPILVLGTPNDGHHDWIVPALAGSQLLVRVSRPNRLGGAPSPFPGRCSSDVSDAAAQVVASNPRAGTVTNLRVETAGGGQIRISWSPSCSPDAVDHVIYEGDLAALRAGNGAVMPLQCSAGADLAEYVVPGAGSRYYLVAPATGSAEGSIGSDSTGAPRPASPASCLVRESDSTCS